MINKKKPIRSIDNELIRLNKFISNSGICSRREADEFIKLGMVNVNGKIITKMGYKVLPNDIIKHDGQVINNSKSVYILINKPKGFLASSTEKKVKKSVNDLINISNLNKIHPFDNMGRTSSGLLLLTNDLYFKKKLNSSKKGVRMIYKITLDKSINNLNLEKINKAHYVNNKKIEFKSVSYISGNSKKNLGIECFNIESGEIIKIFKKINFIVEQIDRVTYGSLTKKDLTRGKWRHLTMKERGFLQMH